MTTDALCDHCSQPSDVDHDPTTDRRDYTRATTTREVDRIGGTLMRPRVIGRVTIHLCEHHAADVDAEEVREMETDLATPIPDHLLDDGTEPEPEDPAEIARIYAACDAEALARWQRNQLRGIIRLS